MLLPHLLYLFVLNVMLEAITKENLSRPCIFSVSLAGSSSITRSIALLLEDCPISFERPLQSPLIVHNLDLDAPPHKIICYLYL